MRLKVRNEDRAAQADDDECVEGLERSGFLLLLRTSRTDTGGLPRPVVAEKERKLWGVLTSNVKISYTA